MLDTSGTLVKSCQAILNLASCRPPTTNTNISAYLGLTAYTGTEAGAALMMPMVTGHPGRSLALQKQTPPPAGAQTAGHVSHHQTDQPGAEALETATPRETRSRLVALLTDMARTGPALLTEARLKQMKKTGGAESLLSPLQTGRHVV